MHHAFMFFLHAGCNRNYHLFLPAQKRIPNAVVKTGDENEMKQLQVRGILPFT
jgi:hypothetical protein